MQLRRGQCVVGKVNGEDPAGGRNECNLAERGGECGEEFLSKLEEGRKE